MPQNTLSIFIKRWKNAQKILLGILLVLGALFCISVLGLSLYVPFLIKKQLEKQVNTGSAHQWQLSIESVNVYWFRSSFAIEGVALTQNSPLAAPKALQDSTQNWRVRINRIECNGISLFKFFREDTLYIKRLRVHQVHIEGHWVLSEDSLQAQDPMAWQTNLQRNLQAITPLLYVGELSLENISWELQVLKGKRSQRHSCQYFYLRVASLALGKNLIFDSLRLHLSHYEGRLASGAVLALQDLSFQSQDSTLLATKLRWEQSPLQKINIESLQIQYGAWQSFLENRAIDLQELRLHRPEVWWVLSERKQASESNALVEQLLQSEAPPSWILSCQRIVLEEAQLHLWQSMAQYHLPLLQLKAQGFQLNTRKAESKERLSLETLTLAAARYRSQAGQQQLAFDSLYYDSAQKYCALLGLAWRQPGLQIALEQAFGQKLDLAALWYERGLSLGEWQFQKPKINLQAAVQAPKNPPKSNTLLPWLRYYDLAGLQVQEADLSWQTTEETLRLRKASFGLKRLFEQAPFRWEYLPQQIALQVEALQVASAQYQDKAKDTEILLEGFNFSPQQFLKTEKLHWQQQTQALTLKGLLLEAPDWVRYWQQKKLYIAKITSDSLHLKASWPESPANQTLADSSAQDSSLALGPVRRFEQTLEQLLEKFTEELRIDTLRLQGLRASLGGTAQKPAQQVEQGELLLTSIALQRSATAKDSLPFRSFLLGNASLHLQNYRLTAPEGNFTVQIQDFRLDKEGALCLLQEIHYQDLQGNTCEIPKIAIQKIDWLTYWEKEYLQLGLLSLPEAKVHLQAKSSQLPHYGHSPLLPLHFREMLAQKAQSLVAQIGTGLAIDSISLQKIHFTLHKQQASLEAQSHQIDSLGLLMTDFRIDSSTQIASPKRFLFAAQLQVAARKYSFHRPFYTLLLKNEYLYWDSRDSSLLAQGLHLSQAEQLDLKVPSLFLAHISLRDYLAEQNLQASDLVLEQPDLHYFYDQTRISVLAKPKTLQEDSVLVWQRQLQGLVPQVARSIHLGRLLLQGGHFQYAQQGYKGLLRQSLESFDLQVMDIHLDSSFLQAPQALFVADRAALRFRNYVFVQPDSMYQLSIAAGNIDTQKRQAKLSEVHYRPLLAEEQIIRAKPAYKSRLNAHAASMALQQIDFAMLLKRNRLVIEKVAIDEVLLSVSDDDRIAGNPKHIRAMPNDLFRALPFYLRIDTLVAETSRIVYKENILGGRGEGALTFEDFEASAYALSNDTLISHSTLWAKAKFMNEGLLVLRLRIPLMKEDFQMDFEGSLGAMDAILINRMIEPNAHVNLKRGQVKRISFEGSLANYVAQGKMLAVYRGFKVRVLKRDSYKKRGLISFLANLLLNQTNKRKQGQIEYYRSGTDGFMKLIWRSIGSGLKDTLLPAIVKRRL